MSKQDSSHSPCPYGNEDCPKCVAPAPADGGDELLIAAAKVIENYCKAPWQEVVEQLRQSPAKLEPLHEYLESKRLQDRNTLVAQLQEYRDSLKIYSMSLGANPWPPVNEVEAAKTAVEHCIDVAHDHYKGLTK